jgi:hypothetical protein
MRWNRAVQHLEGLAQSCAEMAARPTSLFPLRVTQLWAVGDLLSTPHDIDFVRVALCLDLPVDDVAWWSEPHGTRHWADATRVSKNPVSVWWRSAHAPVWNHRIERPALVWDETAGVAAETLEAIRQGTPDSVRQTAPSEDQLRVRLDDELSVSRLALRSTTAAYEARRWSPGRLEPIADDLWRASDGYLDVLSAIRGDSGDACRLAGSGGVVIRGES